MANEQATGKGNAQIPEDLSTLEYVRMIVGGVATIALIVVPVVLIRKLIKTAENSETFKNLNNALIK